MISNLTVVIPSYRAESLIARTLNSLVQTGLARQNIIVVEDGVFDNTKQIIDDFSGIQHIQLQENKGAPYARNTGLELTRTKYVMFLDSDDFISEDHLANLCNEAISAEADITFGPWRMAGEKIGWLPIRYPTQIPAEQWVTRWLMTEFVPSCSVLWSTDYINSIGGWREDLKQNQDGELAIRGLINAKKIAFSKNGYSVYWQHNSPYRVSKAPDLKKLYTANIIYKQIMPWVKNLERKDYKFNLGAFCNMQHWNAISSKADSEIIKMWKARALELGYEQKGYNVKTNLISSIVGVRMSIILRKYIHRPLVNFKSR